MSRSNGRSARTGNSSNSVSSDFLKELCQTVDIGWRDDYSREDVLDKIKKAKEGTERQLNEAKKAKEDCEKRLVENKASHEKEMAELKARLASGADAKKVPWQLLSSDDRQEARTCFAKLRDLREKAFEAASDEEDFDLLVF